MQKYKWEKDEKKRINRNTKEIRAKLKLTDKLPKLGTKVWLLRNNCVKTEIVTGYILRGDNMNLQITSNYEQYIANTPDYKGLIIKAVPLSQVFKNKKSLLSSL